MKILFLDIDGVIKEDKQGAPFLNESLLLLKEIIHETGAFIVISSSWKIKYKAFIDCGFKTDIEDIKALHYAFEENGIKVYDITTTLDIDKKKRRPAEIREFLKNNDNIESFCILDDRAEFEWNELNEKLVLTVLKNENGEKTAHLTAEHAKTAIKILNIE